MQHSLRALSAITVALICTSSGALAQSLPFSFGADGRIGAGYTDQVAGAGIFLFGDATSRLSLTNTAFGFELGVYGLANAADTPHETYGTFTYDFAQRGKLLAGVTRPAYDSFAVSAFDVMLPSVGIATTAATRSQATYGAMFAGFLPYGLRYEATTDKMRFALSVATVPNRDTTIAGFGVAFPIGQLSFESAVEVSRAATTKVSGKVQLKGAIGAVKGGVGLYLPGTNGGPEMAEVFAAFSPVANTTIAGAAQVPLSGGVDPTLGLSARYDFSPVAGITVGLAQVGGADMAYSAHLDWNF